MNSRIKITSRFLISMMIGLIFLAGCAPKGSSDSSTENSILRVAFEPIVQTDPALISSDSEVFIANAVYDYLIDIDGKSNLVPRLATDWRVSEDGLTYTITLARDVKFHDGSPFSAEDVIWTYNRLRDPDLGFATSDLYKNIDNISSSEPYTVIFSLKNPNPFFVYDLSDNHALMIKNGTVDASDFNGTGPFKVAEYNPEDRITLLANPDYFISGQPKLSKVDIIFFPDEIAMIDALRGGQVDLVMRMSTSLYESLQSESSIKTYSIPTNGFDLIRLRSDREPGNNPLVIQALKLATNREELMELVQQGYGAIGNDSPIGPLYESYYDPLVSPPAHDVQAAKDLLIEAGYPDGLNLTLHVPDSGDRPDLAAVLQQQWAEANINVDISVEPESVYYGDNGWLEADLGITGWGSRPYPQFYLDVMLVSDAKWNESHFSDSEFDNLSREAGSTLDENVRKAAYSKIQHLLAERGPIIIPYYFVQFGAINAKFEGFELKAFAGRTDLRPIYIP